MEITVAICTHDRARSLARTLDSLVEIEEPRDACWRLLVIANACTDDTPDVLRSYRNRLPLRSLEEERLGHSHARNRAVAEASGDYLVWTDDDVRVKPGWLAAYARAFARWPQAAFFGGPVRPVFEGATPGWLREALAACPEVRAAYAERELGTEPVPIASEGDLPYGANMALRLDAQRRHAYDPGRGRSGDDLVGGDELAVLRCLLDEGETGRWVPDAGLEHRIPEERQTIDYLRRYFRDQGRIAEPRPEDAPVPELLGRPRWAWRARVTEEAKYRLGRLFAPPRVWIPHLIGSSFARGALMGPPDGSERGG